MCSLVLILDAVEFATGAFGRANDRSRREKDCSLPEPLKLADKKTKIYWICRMRDAELDRQATTGNGNSIFPKRAKTRYIFLWVRNEFLFLDSESGAGRSVACDWFAGNMDVP